MYLAAGCGWQRATIAPVVRDHVIDALRVGVERRALAGGQRRDGPRALPAVSESRRVMTSICR